MTMREKIEQWVFPITIPNILLIVLGVALNVGGRMLSQAFSWPIWADSVGTFLIGILLGPFADPRQGLCHPEAGRRDRGCAVLLCAGGSGDRFSHWSKFPAWAADE